MKKIYQVSGVLILIGLALLFIGKVNHGDQFISNAASHFFTKKAHTRTFKPGKFTKVNLDLSMSDIHIHSGEKYQVSITGPKADKIKASVQQQELTLSSTDSHPYFYFGNDTDNQVDITVPKRNSLKAITGESGEGNLTLTDLDLAKVNITLDDGDTYLDNIHAQNTQLVIDEGDLTVNASVLNGGSLVLDECDATIKHSKFKLNAKVDEGDAQIIDSTILGDSSFKLDEGDFHMTYAPKISYQLVSDSDSDVKFRHLPKPSIYKKKVAHAPTLKVRSSDGDIAIN